MPVSQDPFRDDREQSGIKHVHAEGAHNCLGAHQARLIIRTLLQTLCDQVRTIELLEAILEVEHESSYSRQVGYQSARVRFDA